MGKLPECHECGMLVHSGTCLCSGCLTDWSKRIASTPMVTEGEIEKAAERLCAKLTDSFYKLPPAHQMKVIMVALIDLLAHKGIRVVTDAQADALADDVEKGGGDG